MTLLCCCELFGQIDKERNVMILSNTTVQLFNIHTMNGSLTVKGSKRTNSIRVKAYIHINGVKHSEIDSLLRLQLHEHDTQADLFATMKNEEIYPGKKLNGNVDIKIKMPAHVSLNIYNKAGSISIKKVHGKIKIVDGPGHIFISKGNGRLQIHDEAGNIQVQKVNDRVTINDGAGSIEIDDIKGDVSIADGSGTVTIKQIHGNVALSEGSDPVSINNISGNLLINGRGGGSFNYKNIGGKVIIK